MSPRYSLMPPSRLGLLAILAAAAAVGGMVASCSGHAGRGLLLAILSLPLSLLGLLRSASPRIHGAGLSVLAFIIGLLGVLVALLAMLFNIVLF